MTEQQLPPCSVCGGIATRRIELANLNLCIAHANEWQMHYEVASYKPPGRFWRMGRAIERAIRG